jgi:hypothetical protein
MERTGQASRARRRAWVIAGWLIAPLLLLPIGTQAQPDPPAGTPTRIGPEWGHQKHQPNPAEIEARQRARGVPAAQPDRSATEVDKLYRDLIGSDPSRAPASSPSRAQDRR